MAAIKVHSGAQFGTIDFVKSSTCMMDRVDFSEADRQTAQFARYPFARQQDVACGSRCLRGDG
jgi:hypothetical protein